MKRTTWFLLLAILWLAAALRLHRISEISLRADEATNLFLAAQNPGDIIPPFITDDPHLPLYHFILHFWMLLAGRSELALRFPTVCAGVLIVALTWAFGRVVFARQATIALIGALLAAINPYLIWDAQDAYMYSFLTAVTLGSFITFLRAVRPSASLRVWAAYVVVSALALFFHYLAGLVLVAQGVVWLWLIVRRAMSRRVMLAWITAQAAIAALFLPWLVFALPLLTNFKSNFWVSVSLVEMLGRALIGFTVGRVDSRLMPPMVEPLTGMILASGFLVICVVGLLAPKTQTDRVDVLAIYLFVPLVALFLFSLLRFPIFDERYVLFLIPAFLLILARGFVGLQELTRQKWVPAGAWLFVLLASSHSLYNYWYVPAFAKSPDWQSFARRVVTDSRPGDVLIQNYPDPALPYYLRERVPRVLLPRSGSATAAEVNADLQRLTVKYARVWLQPVPYATWDTEGLVETWLNRHARQLRAYEFRGLRLALYLPASAALRQAKPADAIFAERIRLVAFDLDEASLRPGATAQLVLYWQAFDRVERDATVFAHLYGADGKLWSQQDNAPVRGTFPTSQWEANEIVVDQYDLRIPTDAPTGIYALMVGMYDAQTLRRLNVVDQRGQPLPENRVPLANLNLVSKNRGEPRALARLDAALERAYSSEVNAQ